MSDETPVFPSAPPTRMVLDEGCCIVRVDPELAPAASVAINESLDHLAPWMAWARQPSTPESLRPVFTDGVAAWEARREFAFCLLAPVAASGQVRVVGGCGLHGRLGRHGLEIGYWVHVDHAGRGLATKAARVLTDAAFAIDGIDRVQIKCAADNTASARVPAKLGFEHLGTWEIDTGDGEWSPHQHWQTTHDLWSGGDVPAQR